MGKDQVIKCIEKSLFSELPNLHFDFLYFSHIAEILYDAVVLFNSPDWIKWGVFLYICSLFLFPCYKKSSLTLKQQQQKNHIEPTSAQISNHL